MNAPADNDPSFEDTVAYLKQTLYARPLCKELTERREAAFAAMSVADKDAEVWKAVGRIEALDDLAQVLRPD
tara:strand:+ start:108 stop:323 length:216 start_codon:yes stop_codon:yes gene_type:complete